jgi:hypothetical protein
VCSMPRGRRRDGTAKATLVASPYHPCKVATTAVGWFMPTSKRFACWLAYAHKVFDEMRARRGSTLASNPTLFMGREDPRWHLILRFFMGMNFS